MSIWGYIYLVFWYMLAGTGCAFPNDPNSAAIKTEASSDENQTGPTIHLYYNGSDQVDTAISAFMYFIPMVSPVKVSMHTSEENSQTVDLLSHQIKMSGSRFRVWLNFEIHGRGYYEYRFDPAAIIERGLEDFDTEGDPPLKYMLEAIRIEDGGGGRIEASGVYQEGQPVVMNVDVYFNAGGRRSPVTARLFSVNPENGKYLYENRYESVTVRINKLEFARTETWPRMGLVLGEVRDTDNPGDFLAGIKALFANLFIDPFRINPEGNESMLDFGLALYEQRKTFTFPRAENLVETEPNARPDEIALSASSPRQDL